MKYQLLYEHWLRYLVNMKANVTYITVQSKRAVSPPWRFICSTSNYPIGSEV